jgi:hypothetical protein
VSDIRNDAREFAPRSVVRDLASALEPWRTMIVVLLACGCDTSSAVGESLLDVAARSTIPVGRAPNDVVLGDVDADGRLDIVISNGGSSDLTLLLGREGRRFDRSPSSPVPLAMPPHLVLLEDFDEDGRLDLAITSHDANSVVVLRGDGGAKFTPVTGSPFPFLQSDSAHNHGLAAGDVDGDGHLDLAFANHDADNVSLLLGDGKGAFRVAPGSPFPAGNGPYPLALGDVNGDGRADLVAPNVAAGSLAILTGSSGESALSAPKSIAVSSGPGFVTLGRIDGDDALDILASHAERRVLTILLGGKQGEFAAARTVDPGANTWKVRIADMNADGKSDLVMGLATNTVAVLLGDGSGGFSPAGGSPFAAGRGPWGIAVGDLDRDGRPDVVTANTDGDDITILFGRNPAKR